MGSPFNFGTAASGDSFTDREADTARLAANFRHGVNTIIVSPRRWGKTSLVMKTSSMIRDKGIKIVHMDAFSCRSEEDFYQLFATAVIKQTATRWKEWVENAQQFLSAVVPKISLGVEPTSDFSISFDFSGKQVNKEVLSLPQKIASQKGIRIVVCIDEFQQIAEFDNSKTFQKELRSVWQLQKQVSYILYGSKKHVLSQLFSKQSMPFYKFGDVIFLQKISSENWIRFIQERFKKTGKTINTAMAAQICEKVDNHSHYVQQLSWLVWIRTEKNVGPDDLQQAMSDLLNQNSMLYHRYVESLTAFQLNFLQAVAEGVQSEFTKKDNLKKYNLGTSANITRLKKTLEQKELIDIADKKVTFNDPVFRIWYLKEMRRS